MTSWIALVGWLVCLGAAWLLSSNKRLFPWRTVAAGCGLQLVIAWIILRTPVGERFFAKLDWAFQRLLKFADEGTSMVFGPLASPALLSQTWGPQNGFLFAVGVTGTIVLVASLSSLLYHYGILQMAVRAMAWVMRRLMNVSGSESLAAAANIFMGQTEAPMVVKPYLATMTRSELLSLMTGGMATIAGGMLAAYVMLGVPAGHLLTASVISAPAAILMAKIVLPEEETSATESSTTESPEVETINGLDALCRGASDGMKLAINVMAMIIAFVAVVALANALLSGALAWFGAEEPKPLQAVLGWIHAPLVWLMGVPWKDCELIGTLLGERVVLNEFIGYLGLTQARDQLDERSFTIATYALCGFANFASIAIQIGGISAIAPSRREDLARLGLRSMIAGLLACYSTACVASLLIP